MEKQRLNAHFVWDAFVQDFGKGFLTSFGNVPPDSWIDELSMISMDEVLHGIKMTRHAALEYPPNLSKFIGFCKSFDNRNQEQKARDALAKEHAKRLALPRPPANENAKKENLAKIKQMYGMK